MTQLAQASNVHPSTVGAIMYGTRKPQSEKLDQIADALAVGMRVAESGQPVRRQRELRRKVYELAGIALNQATPFRPHPDADLLDSDERDIVNELIRLLAKPKRGVTSSRSGLSVVADTTDGLIAADEQEQSISGEQMEPEFP